MGSVIAMVNSPSSSISQPSPLVPFKSTVSYLLAGPYLPVPGFTFGLAYLPAGPSAPVPAATFGVAIFVPGGGVFGLDLVKSEPLISVKISLIFIILSLISYHLMSYYLNYYLLYH